jgi:MFS superfamily sulfate permease-like transporter
MLVLLSGELRLGLIVDFLSRSTITGFMGGTAAIIIMQQLKGMLGMKHFTSKTDIISVMRSIFLYRHEVSVSSETINASTYFSYPLPHLPLFP